MPLQTPDPRRPEIGVRELIALVGAMMALNALSIDILLPALTEIAQSYSVSGNAAQLLITAYVFGFGLAQLGFGPAADAYGRRAVLIVSLAGYAAASVLALLANSFETLLAARFLQGLAAAGSRVIAVALVRDLVSGRRMAEIMSFVMTVFMVAPIIAPSLGQLLMLSGRWIWIFAALLTGGAGLLAWTFVRLPETLAPARRSPLSPQGTARNYWAAARNRVTAGYLAASAFVFGALFAFIATSEQMMTVVYDLENWFGAAFAGVAVGLAGANILNARIVGRLGPRRVSHVALCAFIAINSLNAALSGWFNPAPFWIWYPLLTLGMVLFGMIGANFTAIAMEPAGERAGVTAALQGAVTAVSGALLGSLIGQGFDGSPTPVLAGMAAMGVAGLAAVFVTERGRLFTPSAEAERDAAQN